MSAAIATARSARSPANAPDRAYPPMPHNTAASAHTLASLAHLIEGVIMPLYEHGPSKEWKRTVPGSYEDKRVAANPEWKLIPRDTPPPAEEPTPELIGPNAGSKRNN